MTRERKVLQVLSLAGFAACILFTVWGWRTGVLTSQEQMEALVRSCGAAGIVLFVLFQAVQVVVPVLGICLQLRGDLRGLTGGVRRGPHLRKTPFEHVVF